MNLLPFAQLGVYERQTQARIIEVGILLHGTCAVDATVVARISQEKDQFIQAVSAVEVSLTQPVACVWELLA